MKPHVVVIGGGCAGLSCATLLAQKDVPVTLFEKSCILGGRTSSYKDPQMDEVVDNGQHMFLGCYDHTKAFLQRIGMQDEVAFRDHFATQMMSSDGQKAYLKTHRLPSPFHLLWGYLGYKAFELSDRLSILWVVWGLKKESITSLKQMSCREFLHTYRQSEDTQKKFWDLLILATLNIAPEKAPAHLLKIVLEQGFMSSRKDSASGLSKLGLTDLFGVPSQRFLDSRRSNVQSQQRVQTLWVQDGQVQGVVLSDGSKVEATHVVSAIPSQGFFKLVQGTQGLEDLAHRAKQLTPSPIVSLHIWVDQELFEDPYVGFWDTAFHWVFRRSAFISDSSVRHYTLVASGADDLLHASTQELTKLAKETLRPLHKNFEIQHAKKSISPHATWVEPLGQSQARPHTHTPIRNFFIAGDWTDTGLPCTIESAVVSGHKAALSVLGKDLGQKILRQV